MPARTRIDSRERVRILAGTLIGVFLTGLLCHLMGVVVLRRLPWLIAPLGASAVRVLPCQPNRRPSSGR